MFAKGVASGLPLSGDPGPPGAHGPLAPGRPRGTFGGNVVSCAAAHATIEVIEAEGLVANARRRGAQLLADFTGSTPGTAIGDVRGLGLMAAMEFVRPGQGDGRAPDAELTRRVLAEALERRLIVLSAGSYANVARIIPPLVTTEAEVDLALRVLDESIAAATAG